MTASGGVYINIYIYMNVPLDYYNSYSKEIKFWAWHAGEALVDWREAIVLIR